MILVARAHRPFRFQRRTIERCGRRVCAILCVLVAASAAVAPAAAQFLVSPLRAVIDEDTRRAAFVVSNPTDRILDVRAEWIDLAATPEGYEPADATLRSRLSAAPYLTLEPARLRLEPGERGQVVAELRNALAAPAGERRSHLLFAADASRSPLRRTGGGLRADIGLAVSTPVILRGRGRIRTVDARFKSARLERDGSGDLVLNLSIARRGPFSPYGDLVADFAGRDDASPREIARIGNIVVPIDVDERNAALPLGIDVLPKGVLRVRYLGAAEFKGVTFAEKSYDIAAPPDPR